MPEYYDYWWVWCLLLVLGFGGCLGSFANVIIFRLPRGIPLGDPLWSFCPNCQQTIRWYDNIPVISYFRLGGRCRRCHWPIPPRYVIIEVITILIFLILFDAFFVGSVISGVTGSPWSISYRFYNDWPIYAAHAILFSCLLAMSAIDMEQYWVDIRYTHLAALCAFLLHGVWTPNHQPSWPRPDANWAAGATLATLGALGVHLFNGWRWKKRVQQEQIAATLSESNPSANLPTGLTSADSIPLDGQPSKINVEELADRFTSQNSPLANGMNILDRNNGALPHTPPMLSNQQDKTFPASAWLAGVVLYCTITLLVVFMVRSPTHSPAIFENSIESLSSIRWLDSIFLTRILPGIIFVFLCILGGGMVRRPTDIAIEQTLEFERPSARKIALLEFISLLLPIGLFVIGVWATGPNGPWQEGLGRLWGWQPFRNIQPLKGIGTAAVGFVGAAAIGWAVRITFTLLLGKEAFGSGDIHIMAAAGAVVGWPVVAVGFFLSSLLALLGWIVTYPLKRGHALPMGPWLTLGIFIMTILRDPVILEYFTPRLNFLITQFSGLLLKK